MSTNKTENRYDEAFKRTLVNLYQSDGKSQAALCKAYGVSATAVGRSIKQQSTVETDNGEVLTAKQIKELQKRNAQLEEELLILKKAIAIFTSHSNNDQMLFISSASSMTSKSFARYQVSTEVLITSITIHKQLIALKKISKQPNLFCKFMLITTGVLVLTKSPMFFSVIMAFSSVSVEFTV